MERIKNDECTLIVILGIMFILKKLHGALKKKKQHCHLMCDLVITCFGQTGASKPSSKFELHFP